MIRIYNDPAAFVYELLQGAVAATPHLELTAGGLINPKARANEVSVVVAASVEAALSLVDLVASETVAGVVLGDFGRAANSRDIIDLTRRADRGRGVLLLFPSRAAERRAASTAVRALLDEGFAIEAVEVATNLPAAQPSVDAPDTGHALLNTTRIAKRAVQRLDRLDVIARVAARASRQTRSALFHLEAHAAPRHFLSEASGTGSLWPAELESPEPPTADGLAERLLEDLMAAPPAGVDGHVPLGLTLTGTEGVGYSELLVLYRRLHELMTEAGLPHPHAQITRGGPAHTAIHVSATWLDASLADLWF